MCKVRLLFLFLVFLSLGARAQVLENYDGLWESAQEESWLGSNNRIDLQVDLASFPESNLRIKLPSKSTVFIDGKLWRLTSRDTVFFRSLADFQAEFGQDTVTFTVVSPNLGPKKTSIQKVLGLSSIREASVDPEGNPITGRFVPQPVKDFYFTALFIILFFLALYKLAYPYLLAMMLQPLSVINAEDFSDSGNLQKFFSFDVIFYILIVAMMISQGAVTSLVVFSKDWLETWIGLDYSSLLTVWLGGAFLILALTIVKFIAIKLISYLFDLGKAEFSHFFYLLRLVVFGCAVVLLVGAYFVSNDFSGLESALSLLLLGFFWFYIFGVLGLFLIMMSRLSFKKYHLFTYLCIAELVPFLILAKWIMDLGQ
ncbi:DUF4271 domain-containing protein [Algoriphagus sp. H41]|uniref:DUF4271 domain-containing protein n=1 Tax=Algoriphagus oliviformis TaxID=2811231 RepID=A0ABS3BYG4_9BACT|nr:DUF4271 domain-containing protein [Algoriphagus oliviformis]MBN7809456.1 DUF4271 domain-containing protein [Algoriphagus oliviformis]